jgi:hypothetical protein
MTGVEKIYSVFERKPDPGETAFKRAIVVGLSHRSTFSDKYGLRQKGSRSGA